LPRSGKKNLRWAVPPGIVVRQSCGIIKNKTVPKTIENRDTRRKEIVPPEISVQPIAEVFIFKTNRRLNVE
jgi:hypothetical protein